MNRDANVTKGAKIGDDWRHCQVVLAGNGRIKPHLAIMDAKTGLEERHEEGNYYVEWYERRTRRRECVGNARSWCYR